MIKKMKVKDYILHCWKNTVGFLAQKSFKKPFNDNWYVRQKITTKLKGDTRWLGVNWWSEVL